MSTEMSMIQAEADTAGQSKTSGDEKKRVTAQVGDETRKARG